MIFPANSTLIALWEISLELRAHHSPNLRSLTYPFCSIGPYETHFSLIFFARFRSVISEWDRSRSSAASTGIEAKQDYASIFRVGNHLFSLMNGTSFGNMLASFGMRTAAEVITYPIASIMTRIAVQPNVPANKLLKYIDPRQTFQTILNEEGFAGLYKGFSSQVVSNAIGAVIPYVASKIFEPAIDEMAAAWNKVQLRFSDHAKQTGGVVVQTDSQKSALSKIVKHYWEELNQPRVIGLGLLSAAVYAGFMPLSYSFALLSTRLRVHGMDIFPQHYFGFHPHMNLMDMISSIYDTEGVYGLVRGSLWKFLWSQLTTGAILVRSFYKPTVWVQ